MNFLANYRFGPSPEKRRTTHSSFQNQSLEDKNSIVTPLCENMTETIRENLTPLFNKQFNNSITFETSSPRSNCVTFIKDEISRY